MFQIEVDENTKVKGQLQNERLGMLFREFVEDLADFAKGSFQRHVPIGDTFRTFEAVNSTRAVKRPFGYEASAGVGRVPTLGRESSQYPLFVHRGTGIFNRDGGTPIYPTHGNVLVFHNKAGEKIFTRWVKGQVPQPYLEEVRAETNAYYEAKKHELKAIVKYLF